MANVGVWESRHMDVAMGKMLVTSAGLKMQGGWQTGLVTFRV